MVLNQTSEVRRKEKQNNLGEKKKVKLYVNYFSPSSTFICAVLLTIIFQRFVTQELQLCFTNRRSILQSSRLLDFKLTPKSSTDGIVYRVVARLSTARVFSGRICTP